MKKLLNTVLAAACCLGIAGMTTYTVKNFYIFRKIDSRNLLRKK